MKLQDQVCTLEQGEKLKGLGVAIYGPYVHVKNRVVSGDSGIKPKEQTGAWKAFGKIKDGGVINYYPAFTVAELGVMLPEEIEHSFNDHSSYYFMQGHGINPSTEKNEPCCWYEDNDLDPVDETMNNKYFGAKTEAEARAEMLIYLLENKLITAEEVNNRLTQTS